MSSRGVLISRDSLESESDFHVSNDYPSSPPARTPKTPISPRSPRSPVWQDARDYFVTKGNNISVSVTPDQVKTDLLIRFLGIYLHLFEYFELRFDM